MEIRRQRVQEARCKACDGLGYSVGVDRRHVCQACFGSGQAFVRGDGRLPRSRAIP
jgi:DnaJ-class molecular chaperone